MPPLPIKFDENEWFIVIVLVLGYTWVWLIPKRYPKAASALVILFCVSVAIIMDHTLTSPPLEWYVINDHKTYEWMDVITYFMYSPFALISVYYYQKWNPKGLYFTAYVVGWSVFCCVFEWAAVRFHVFTFYRWNLIDSFAFYLAATALHVSLFRLIMKHFKQHPTEGYI